MELPLQLILFSIPSIIYLFIQRLRKQDWSSISAELGLAGTGVKFLAAGLGLGLLPGLLAFLLPNLLPADLLDQPGVAQSV